MPISHAIILGIIQGLTEALPISSSAHLVVVPWFFKWQYQGLSFDVALHIGTALAIAIYFFKDWVNIIKSAFTKDKTRGNNLLWYIIIATIPAAFAGALLKDKIEEGLRSPLIIAATLFVFAIFLWLADYFGKKQKQMDKIGLKSALGIGIAQALALVPGVSRSGITITAGLFEGFSRETAARFSFLLSTPIVISAAILKLAKLAPADLNAAFWAGVISSAISGLIGVSFLLRFVKKSNMNVFVIYRIILAVVMLVVFIVK